MELATKRNYKSEQIEKPDISVCIYRTPKIFRYNVYRISTIKMLCVPLFHLHMCIVRSPPPPLPLSPPLFHPHEKKRRKTHNITAKRLEVILLFMYPKHSKKHMWCRQAQRVRGEPR